MLQIGMRGMLVMLGVLLGVGMGMGMEYREELRLGGDGVLRIQFDIGQQYLPIPLRDIEQQITIRYGPYYHQYFPNLSTNTISTQIYLSTPIPQHLLSLLQATFSISLPPRYSSFTPESNLWHINDPNDKFCTHHIEEIVRNLLPCGSNAGLAQLVQLEGWFGCGADGRRMYGMEVRVRGGIRVALIAGVHQGFEGIRRVKVNEKCLTGSELIMMDAKGREISLKEVVLARLEESIREIELSPPQMKLKASRHILGNWYNPSKVLQIFIQAESITNGSSVIVRELLPARAGVSHISVQNLNSGFTELQLSSKCTLVNNEKEEKYKTPSSLCEIRVNNLNVLFQKQEINFVIRIEMENRLICFDNFEAIFGGGAELPSLPILLLDPEDPSQNSYYSGPASLRTPEPDQSLPFQVMTFTLGIFGYLWISIWRKLVSDWSKKDDE